MYRQAMKFVKMHGLGNDYVYVDCFHETLPEAPETLARKMADRHTGVGGDGLILILPDADCDARMRMFNADGSEGKMCGNGIRCVGKYLYDSGLRRKETLRIATLAGVRTLAMQIEDGRAVGATVDMGTPTLDERPVTCHAAGHDWSLLRVCTGSDHAVCFPDEMPDEALFLEAGRALECDPAFPNRANIEFCEVLAPDLIRVLVWERGSGATRACGTGASAVVAAASALGYAKPACRVRLPGGELFIEWRADGHLAMTGPAELSFVGAWRNTAD